MNTQNINWTKFWTALSGAFASLLTGLAVVPYELGPLATVISPEWKPRIAVIGFVSAFILRTFYGIIPTKQTTEKPPEA